MGRLYVPSTPASRGESVPDPQVDVVEPPTVAEVAAAAEALGFRLVPIEPEQEADKPAEEPAGNAATEEWVAYAKTKGATDEDLKDEKGDPLGQKALREKFGAPKS
jgi:hypothetical protein